MSIKNLCEIEENKLLHYWCNGCGEINIPGADKLKCGTVVDLPRAAAEVYEKYWTEGIGGAYVYVVTYDGVYGLLFSWEFDLATTLERFGFGPNDGIGLELFHNAVRQTAEEYELAHGTTVFYGEETQPLGNEISLFVPLEQMNKDPGLYTYGPESDKAISAITEWLYTAVDKKITDALAEGKRASMMPAAEKLEKLTSLLRSAVDSAEAIRSHEDSMWDEDKDIVRHYMEDLLDTLVNGKELLAKETVPEALSAEQEKDIFFKVEHEYRLEDAANHLGDHFNINPEEDVEDNPGAYQLFTDVMGCSYDEACNPSSEHYVLDELVKLFERYQDANVAENDTWAYAVSDFIKSRTQNDEQEAE